MSDMSEASTQILVEHQKAQLEQLAVWQEYQQQIKDPHVKLALSFIIEDTQEAIARAASRLRQISSLSINQISDEVGDKLLWQARSRRELKAKILFVHNGLKHQLVWYETKIGQLQADADTQATFVALAEQMRVRLARWERLMAEMKVSPEG